mmetsp:Transcript_47383/g.106575  ORF Transcript_47383/g.106575 Transcript_47383/m.106575 type:complete len:240 (+) Transcript_47383:549-1268(+)
MEHAEVRGHEEMTFDVRGHHIPGKESQHRALAVAVPADQAGQGALLYLHLAGHRHLEGLPSEAGVKLELEVLYHERLVVEAAALKLGSQLVPQHFRLLEGALLNDHLVIKERLFVEQQHNPLDFRYHHLQVHGQAVEVAKHVAELLDDGNVGQEHAEARTSHDDHATREEHPGGDHHLCHPWQEVLVVEKNHVQLTVCLVPAVDVGLNVLHKVLTAAVVGDERVVPNGLVNEHDDTVLL